MTLSIWIHLSIKSVDLIHNYITHISLNFLEFEVVLEKYSSAFGD
jgi:hypothetical protein